MADDDPKTRRTKLRELRQKRQAQPGYEGNRTGLKGLWANMAGEAGEGGKRKPMAGAGEGAEEGDAGMPKAPFLRHLLQNPKIRQTVVGWLGQSGAVPGMGAQGITHEINSNDFGLERLGKEDITTSSTPDEIVRYRQQLENRADWLEAALEETLMELDRVSHFQTSADEAGQEAAPKKKAAAKAGVKKTAVAKKKTAVKKTSPKKKSVAKARTVKKGT